jgi:hypothetical protein
VAARAENSAASCTRRLVTRQFRAGAAPTFGRQVAAASWAHDYCDDEQLLSSGTLMKLFVQPSSVQPCSR